MISAKSKEEKNELLKSNNIEQSASQTIEDEDTNVIFDMPRKKDTHESTKSNNVEYCQNTNAKVVSKDIKYCQSLSQEIDSDSMQTKLFDQLELSSVCPRIEGSNINLNECVEDVSSSCFFLLLYPIIQYKLYTKAYAFIFYAKLYIYI